MPDRDVFNRHVTRGFQNASRRLLGCPNDPNAHRLLLRAMAVRVRDDGCPGFSDIVEIVADALQVEDRITARCRAQARFNRVRCEFGSAITQIAVQAGGPLLASPEIDNGLDGTAERDKLQLDIAVRLLASLGDAWICPALMLPELVEEGDISFQELFRRRERAKELLISAPESRRLAQQLLANPTGAKVTVPRQRRTKMPQEEILNYALAD